jgi:type IV secretory pathway protease TraF
VCVQQQAVLVDGEVVTRARSHDAAQRPLHAWGHCRRLVEGELFLLSRTNPASFDSRYFGPITVADVLGIARPLWTGSDS